MPRRLSVHKTIWPLRSPFRITGHIFENIDPVCVEIAEGELIGRGEGVSVYYLGETSDSLMTQIEAMRPAIEAGMTREELQTAMPTGGARNAVDCALWDLECKIAGRSIWELANVAQKPIETVYTISIENDVAHMAAKAADAINYPTLKVKLDGDQPLERMRAIRSARPDAKLVVDANQGFSFEQLEKILPAFADLDVAMVEQPLPREGDDCLEGFESSVPLCADESCLHRGDLGNVLPRYDMINIKLDKTGGLTEALALASEARKNGKRLMVGNMLGSSLSMAPAFVIAQLCDFVDLDGPLSLKSDYLNGMKYSGANVSLPQGSLWGSPKTK